MLLIAMTLSAMGVYGFFADAYSHKSMETIPIEMVIEQKRGEIAVLENEINVNNEQLKQFDGKAYNKYTEMGYVTKALNIQKEQQRVTSKLYDDNRLKNQEITRINKEILELQLEAEKKSPTLAHIKYYAKLLGVDDDTAIIIFIVMIMTVFDTLAMYLMITADWISSLQNDSPTLPKPVHKSVEISLIENELRELKKELKKSSAKSPETIVETVDVRVPESLPKASESLFETLSRVEKSVLNNSSKPVVKTVIQRPYERTVVKSEGEPYVKPVNERLRKHLEKRRERTEDTTVGIIIDKPSKRV